MTAAGKFVMEKEPKVAIKNGHPDSPLYYRALAAIRRAYMKTEPVASKRSRFARDVAKLMAASILQEVGEEAAANRVWE
jgi:hypothetical protein